MEGEMEKINNLYTYSKVGKNNTIDPVFYAMNFESKMLKDFPKVIQLQSYTTPNPISSSPLNISVKII